MSTRLIARVSLVLATLLMLPGDLFAQSEPPIPVTGRTLKVRLALGGELQGELIEASDAGLLLRNENGLQTVAMSDVDRIRWQRHGFTARKVMTWVAIGAAVTAVGMTAACSSVEDTDCGGVFPAMVLSWGIFGGLFGAPLASSAWSDLPYLDTDLRAYSRFPQGAPEGFGSGGGPGRR